MRKFTIFGIFIAFLFLLSFSNKRPSGGLLWNKVSYPADSISYTTGDITIKYQYKLKYADGGWGQIYTNIKTTMDSICVVGSIKIDSSWFYIPLTLNYTDSIRMFAISAADTDTSAIVYMGGSDFQKLSLFMLLDYDADSSKVDIIGIMRGN